MNKNDFYIGWKDELPERNKSFLKKMLIPLFIAIPVFAFIAVYGQRIFNNHSFNLGEVKEYTGVYYDNPVPMLIVNKNDIPQNYCRAILLVGYGKFGAEGIISKIEEKSKKLNGHKITIQGTPITGDGRVLIELTKEEESLVKVHGLQEVSISPLSDFADVDLKGEIIDPKCYFGVMKPGEGKIHKSCAIRCISGGIPPILKVKGAEFDQYYILKGNKGQNINKEILPYVAEQITISGKSKIVNQWNLLYADLTSIDKI